MDKLNSIIYALERIDTAPFVLSKKDIRYDKYPNPRLIKYGYNSITDNLNMLAITNNEHYKAGLKFDLSRTDAKSLSSQAKKKFGIKEFDNTVAEFWEIMSVIFESSLDHTIITNRPDEMSTVLDIKKKVFGAHKSKVVKKGGATLGIYKFSDTDLEENAYISILLSELKEILSNKTEHLILQMFGLQTSISAELIYWLSSHYEKGYIFRPMCISELSSATYLVFKGVKKELDATSISGATKSYLVSITKDPIPTSISSVLQCYNAQILPLKYKVYDKIKEFLDMKIYEGAEYQEMIQAQDVATDLWLNTYSDPETLQKMFDIKVNQNLSRCDPNV